MGGRWNPPASFAVLYLALEPQTVIAEFRRLATRQGLHPTAFLPRMLYEYEVRLRAVLDVRDETAQTAVGLAAEDLVADDPVQCQQVGEAAFTAGREGILAPSATGTGEVLAVFLERLSPASYVNDVKSQLWEEVPSL